MLVHWLMQQPPVLVPQHEWAWVQQHEVELCWSSLLLTVVVSAQALLLLLLLLLVLLLLLMMVVGMLELVLELVLVLLVLLLMLQVQLMQQQPQQGQHVGDRAVHLEATASAPSGSGPGNPNCAGWAAACRRHAAAERVQRSQVESSAACPRPVGVQGQRHMCEAAAPL